MRWQSIKKLNQVLVPAHLLECMNDTGSLTRHLEKHCSGEFSLRLINQSWQKPMSDEARLLRLDTGSVAMVREINIQCNDIPWVYGRSIIPEGTLYGTRHRLAKIGQRSLGDYLFSEAGVSRGQIEIARITHKDALFHLAVPQDAGRKEILWGRRSVFRIKNRPLLIIEVFLPDFIRWMSV